MLSYNELKPGQLIVFEGVLYEVLEANFLRMQQRKPVMKTKLRDLIGGKVKEQSFQMSDNLEEAELERMKSKFLYENKGQYWFDEIGNPKNRFFFTADQLGMKAQFLKSNIEVTVVKWNDKIVNVQLPIKMDLKIVEAPPNFKGDTATGGTKVVILETGAKVNVPMFVNEGDIIRVNTELGEYVERAQKN
ncbi:MAG TPA: elongation factor P [Candidatus Paceibacterota bacterium]|nr:elongation factor P [Candidatus Paceibacterota bacterium]